MEINDQLFGEISTKNREAHPVLMKEHQAEAKKPKSRKASSEKYLQCLTLKGGE